MALNSSRLLSSHGSYSSGETIVCTTATTTKEENERDIGVEAVSASAEKGNLPPTLSDSTVAVTWDGPDDPENPKNWSITKKWAAALIVSCFSFISPLSSSIVSPAIQTIASDFHINSDGEAQLMLSIFLLGYTIGPLIIGPLSEIHGRAIVLQLANLFYLVFSLACGFSQSQGQMIAFRLLSGLGGSASLAIGGGILGDCFKPEERGKAMALYGLAPSLGPILGPIVGGFLVEKVSWRWIFYSTSIADGVLQLVALFLLRETYGPEILRRKAKRLSKETGNPAYLENSARKETVSQLLLASLSRPLRLLTTQPIVQFLAIYTAYNYGLIYVFISTFPTLWTSPSYYNEQIGISSLNFLSLGIGFLAGSQICAMLNDRIYKALKEKNNNSGKPEFRIPLLVLTAVLTPAGLFIYGWTAEKRMHWIAPNIGALIFAIGSVVALQCTQSYLVDSYTKYAASAFAAISVLRSLAGFAFPLFAPYLYQRLQYGWGNSVLAFISIGLGIPGAFLLWRYGQRLRELSTYAAGQ